MERRKCVRSHRVPFPSPPERASYVARRDSPSVKRYTSLVRLQLRRARALSLALLFASCRLSSTGVADNLPPVPAGALRVLFIGNSLTYVNDLPRTVADMAVTAGVAPCWCITVAFPDYALLDHLASGDAERVLKTAKFDFVVMQQGSSALAEGRSWLLSGSQQFAPLIAQAGARAALYSVWPTSDRQFDFPGVLTSYRLAAESVSGLLLPAGQAWLEAWSVEGTLPLYASDGLHPSTMGTYLAALVVFQRLYNRSPVGVQEVARVAGVAMPWPAMAVRALQEAAARANAAEGRP